MEVKINLKDLIKLVLERNGYKKAYEICEGGLCSYRTIVSENDLAKARKVLKENEIKNLGEK